MNDVKLVGERYNGVRRHSAIGYIVPNDVIREGRDAKLDTAREARGLRRTQVQAA